jgi:hypothetical protein
MPILLRYDLFPNLGVNVDQLACECGFENIINCPEPGPMKRLSANACMSCGKVLKCPKCGADLLEAAETERDKILICSNISCGLFFSIW